jgi:glycogen operon protein
VTTEGIDVASTRDRSFPYPLGVSLRGDHANVAVYSASAELIEFCVFDDTGQEHRTPLSDRTGHVFHGLIPDVGPGTKYALRVHCAWNPKAGLRHNPHKLLLDPHATAISGDYS